MGDDATRLGHFCGIWKIKLHLNLRGKGFRNANNNFPDLWSASFLVGKRMAIQQVR